MSNIYITIDTLGEAPDAAVLSITAVEFDTISNDRIFHKAVSIDSCLKRGLKIEEKAILWWLSRDENERMAAVLANRISLEEALCSLKAFCKWKNKLVWTDNTTNALTVLTTAYKNIKEPLPWDFYNTRCCTTLKSLISHADYEHFCKPRSLSLLEDPIADAVQATVAIKKAYNFLTSGAL